MHGFVLCDVAGSMGCGVCEYGCTIFIHEYGCNLVAR